MGPKWKLILNLLKQSNIIMEMFNVHTNMDKNSNLLAELILCMWFVVNTWKMLLRSL